MSKKGAQNNQTFPRTRIFVNKFFCYYYFMIQYFMKNSGSNLRLLHVLPKAPKTMP